MYSSLWLDTFFVASAAILWFMIVYQLLLFVTGYLYSRRDAWVVPSLPRGSDWPMVSILVPARNEARVIDGTLEHLLALDYPADRMEIIIIDDGSNDGTGDIVETIAARDARVRCLKVPPHLGGRGKSAALKLGVDAAQHDLIAIYDADNRPEAGSLRALVAALVADPNLAATVGKFRCINRNRNLLTRFINIECLAFQWIMQAGRWSLLGVTTLPGTNFVIRREVLSEVDGWDEKALTEDAELTIRIYETGRRIGFVPRAVTWEQEPEKITTWFRQRTRWARGHNYVLAKHVRRLLELRPRVIAFELLYTLILYYVVCAAIFISDLLFIMAVFGLVSIHAIGPYSRIWVLAFLLFVLEVSITLSREKDEDSLYNLVLVVFAYFTYCQLWVLVVARAFVDDVILRRKKIWAKTERFAEVPE
ncbi:MAG TPA: glycosyltransferase [Syntrophorhabdaceae bacterium]|nr:glycosyltransferase [Syntrophorhabdaceae bacterium]